MDEDDLEKILADDGTTDLNWAQDESVVVGETDSLYVLGWERQVETCQDRNRTAQCCRNNPAKNCAELFWPPADAKSRQFSTVIIVDKFVEGCLAFSCKNNELCNSCNDGIIFGF